MDTLYYLSFVIITLALIGSIYLGYITFNENRKRESELKEEILQLIAKQNLSNKNTDSNLIAIDALRNELTEIINTKTDGSHLIPLLSSLAERLESQGGASANDARSTSSKTSNNDDHSVYNHAIRLAKENQPAEKIVEICGIEPSEAELIVRMHGVNAN